MGRRMKLFGVPSALWHDELQHMTPNHQRAYSSAAWGGFKTLMYGHSLLIETILMYAGC